MSSKKSYSKSTKSKTGSCKRIQSNDELSKAGNLIKIFTDGSCVGNGKSKSFGGIGIVFPNGEIEDISKVFRKGYATNQKAELYAIYYAIKMVKSKYDLDKYEILIVTDSEYSINALTRWIFAWEKNGWKTTNNLPVANKEFIEPIHKYCSKYTINFKHVRSHTGKTDADSLGNDMADRLATKATERAIQEAKEKEREETKYRATQIELLKPKSKSKHK